MYQCTIALPLYCNIASCKATDHEDFIWRHAINGCSFELFRDEIWHTCHHALVLQYTPCYNAPLIFTALSNRWIYSPAIGWYRLLSISREGALVLSVEIDHQTVTLASLFSFSVDSRHRHFSAHCSISPPCMRTMNILHQASRPRSRPRRRRSHRTAFLMSSQKKTENSKKIFLWTVYFYIVFKSICWSFKTNKINIFLILSLIVRPLLELTSCVHILESIYYNFIH